MRSLLIALAVALATVATALIGALPAQATTCPTSAFWVATSTDEGYTCGDKDSSGSQSIGAGKTHSYTATTSGESVKGNTYFSLYYCNDTSSSAVTVAQASAFNSMTATATNWLTPSNTRHWAAGILWAVGTTAVNKGQYSTGCSSSGTIKNNLLAASTVSASQISPVITAGSVAAFAFTATPTTGTGQVLLCVNSTKPIAGTANACGSVSGYYAMSKPTTLVNGTATVYIQPTTADTYTVIPVLQQGPNAMPAKGSTMTITVQPSTASPTPTASPSPSATVSPSPSATPSPSASPTVTASSTSSATASASPSTSATGTVTTSLPLTTPRRGVLARSTRVPGLNMHVVQTTGTMPTSLTATCPKGSVLVHADTLTDGIDDVPLQEKATSVTVGANPTIDGQVVTLQAVCRDRAARPVLRSLLGYGSAQNDILSTNGRRAHLFGGLGNDTLTVTQPQALAFGGLGNDTVTVSSGSGVAVGGPGNDTLRATTSSRALLDGGPGNDTFYGGPGPTYINARDGHAGDVIHCSSPKNIVLADPGDVIHGACTKKNG